MASKSFLYETYYEQKLNFEIDDTHFKFRLDDQEQLIAPWSDIESLKINRFGNTLDIRVSGFPKTIKIPFVTDEFLVFLEELISKMANANQDKIENTTQAFTVSRVFYSVMALIMSAAGILLVTLLMDLSALAELEGFPQVVALLVPSALLCYGAWQPIKITPTKTQFILRGLVRKSVFDYSNVETIGFELLDMKKRGKLLVAFLKLKNGKKVQIKWLKDLILFFMVSRARLDAYQKK